MNLRAPVAFGIDLDRLMPLVLYLQTFSATQVVIYLRQNTAFGTRTPLLTYSNIYSIFGVC